jgi:exodeoxyribonuclease VII large subunit
MPISLTVSELNSYLRELLDADEALRDVWVAGEISNFARAGSGHCYFSLKEGNAVVRAAMWRTYAARLAALPNNGDAVLAHGRVSFYEPRGELQLYVDMVRPAGEGLMYARLAELKARLAAEGLFDESRKRPLPPMPRRIGVATSPGGAALQDILAVLAQRYPLAEVVLAGCQVQGTEAPASIVRALQTLFVLHQHTPLDVLILARGGGAIEDLWSFNDEQVARAVFASPVPLITGVGHESDTTLVDAVADVRAPTPSAAAALAVPDAEELALGVAALHERLHDALALALTKQRNAIASAITTLQHHHPQARLALARQQVDDLLRRAATQMRHAVALRRAALQQMQVQLATLSPQATLQRGYALVRRATDGSAVTQAHQVVTGEMLTITLQQGSLLVKVAGVREGDGTDEQDSAKGTAHAEPDHS